MVAMSDQEIFVQIVFFEAKQRYMMCLGQATNSFVIEIAKRTPDTKPVEVPSVDWHTEYQWPRPQFIESAQQQLEIDPFKRVLFIRHEHLGTLFRSDRSHIGVIVFSNSSSCV